MPCNNLTIELSKLWTPPATLGTHTVSSPHNISNSVSIHPKTVTKPSKTLLRVNIGRGQSSCSHLAVMIEQLQSSKPAAWSVLHKLSLHVDEWCCTRLLSLAHRWTSSHDCWPCEQQFEMYYIEKKLISCMCVLVPERLQLYGLAPCQRGAAVD